MERDCFKNMIFMEKNKQLTFNTALTGLVSVLLIICGFIGTKIYEKVELTHDNMITLRSTHELQILDLKVRMTALEEDWRKWKEKHP